MCLVLKMDNGKVVYVANRQNHRITKPSSTVLVYRYALCIYMCWFRLCYSYGTRISSKATKMNEIIRKGINLLWQCLKVVWHNKFVCYYILRNNFAEKR